MSVMDRKTKIVATLGPASASVEGIRALVEAGAAVFRLNCSHLSTDGLRSTIELVRRAAPESGVLVDVQGPKMRYTGEERLLVDGQEVDFTFTELGLDQLVDGATGLSVAAGQRLLLHDGRLTSSILSVGRDSLRVRVLDGGALKPGKGVNLPDTAISGDLLSEKDRADIAVAREADVEVVAVSFVQSAHDVAQVRSLMGSTGLVIAKIERPQALGDLDAILAAGDGVMAARGDLGVEIPYEDVPPVQRRLARRAIEMGKISICATEMLESMISSTRPTRAEVADVSAAVRDGFDAVMLSGETAVGDDPAGAVRAMARICRGAETDVSLPNLFADANPETAAVTAAASALAKRIGADAILALTYTGYSARLLAACRPNVPVIAVTPDVATARSLVILRGAVPLVVERPGRIEDAIPIALDAARSAALIDPGRRIVVCASRMSPRSDADTLWLHTEP
jgi:pyruvate kinase